MRLARHLIFAWAAFVLALMPLRAATEAASATENVLKVRVLANSAGRDFTKSRQYLVLDLVLQKSGRPYDLAMSGLIARPYGEPQQLIEQPGVVNVMFHPAEALLENQLRPIYYPIFGGRQSYWQPLVPLGSASKFSHVQSVEDLRAFTVLQGRGWPTIPSLERNGIQVVTGNNRNLLNMIVAGRADFYLQTRVFASPEQIARLNARGLERVEHFALYIPLIHIFYVAPDNDDLYDAIVAGFDAAIADGSLEQLHADEGFSLENVNPDLRIFDMGKPNLSDAARRALEEYGGAWGRAQLQVE